MVVGGGVFLVWCGIAGIVCDGVSVSRVPGGWVSGVWVWLGGFPAWVEFPCPRLGKLPVRRASVKGLEGVSARGALRPEGCRTPRSEILREWP
ncbi:hypothetical protein GCM10017744_103440 [Streptomyces antimycoticus]